MNAQPVTSPEGVMCHTLGHEYSTLILPNIRVAYIGCRLCGQGYRLNCNSNQWQYYIKNVEAERASYLIGPRPIDEGHVPQEVKDIALTIANT